ncbi:Mini-ribonuclease 3 [Xylocopilactobacillus apicola]|uniref:Mini-ribonuclease 3 n=1 Tax=Xylocopilactobacillus apicola TaxID=2932184 RepID=A0AAU9D5U4_9LACO|nr:ribonuclease III domain-containing protein [Xylocopilactobacillus apicola]BDR58888.1 mini-ribonuclease 3 [Xylocopilactobacillus apicola]
MTNVNQLNGLTLAYLGDAVIEERVRFYLVKNDQRAVNEQYLRSKSFVSAKAQAAFFKLMNEKNILTTEEQDAFRLGRNAKSHTHAKNTNIVIYRISTGFEAMFGYLKFTDQNDRINQLIDFCFQNQDNVEFIK